MNDAIQSIDHNRIINVGSVTKRSALFYCTPFRLVKLHASHKYSSDDSLTATPPTKYSDNGMSMGFNPSVLTFCTAIS